MTALTLGVLAVVLCCLVSGSDVFPRGHKWVYSYRASAQVGTKDPQTGWDFSGTLNVWSTSDKVYMKLDDVKTSRFNVNETKIKDEPIPKDAEMIEHLFAVNYVGAKVESISVSPKDPLWSVNIKRAIAGVFQLDFNQIHEPASYIQEENIYGKCSQIEYVVTNSSDEMHISKNINVNKCEAKSINFKTTKDFMCQPVAANAANAIRNYVLHFKGGFYNIKDVKTSSEKIMYSFSDKSSSMRMTSKQDIHLIDTRPKEGKVDINEALTEKKQLPFEPSTDFKQGRSVTNQDDSIKAMHKLAKKIDAQLGSGISFHPKVMHDHGINALFWMMTTLNYEGYEKYYATIKEQSSCLAETEKNMFLGLLPYVGSHDSLMFIKHLLNIPEERSGIFTMHILMQMPFYAEETNDKLLEEFEFLLDASADMGQADVSINVLSFANLVYKTYERKRCSEATFEKYVQKLHALFSGSKRLREKVLYLHALSNLELGSVPELMKPHVADKRNSRHTRFLAAWAVLPVAHRQPEEMYKLFWPIMTDRSEFLEMRAAAMSLLMIAQPDVSRLMSIFWYVKSEPSDQLHNHFYTIVKSTQHSTFPCHRKLRIAAEKIVNYVQQRPSSERSGLENNQLYNLLAIGLETLPIPSSPLGDVSHLKTITENILQSYANDDHLFGMIYHLLIVNKIGSMIPQISYGMFVKYENGQTYNQMAVMYKQIGIRYQNVISRTPVDEIHKVLHSTKAKLHALEEYYSETALKISGKTIFNLVYTVDANKDYNQTPKNEAVEEVRNCSTEINRQFVFWPTMVDEYLPTDFGTSTYNGEMRLPLVSFRTNHTRRHDENFRATILQNDLDFRYEWIGEKGMEVFNPIVDMYHFVAKDKKLTWNLAHENLTFVDSQRKNVLLQPHKGKNYVVMHGRTVGAMGTVEDLLVGSADQPLRPVEDDVQKFEIPLGSLGIRVVVSAFDCPKLDEVQRFISDCMEHFAEIKNSDDPSAALAMAMSYISDKVLQYYPEERCGFAAEVLPLYQEPSLVDFAMQVEIRAENQTASCEGYFGVTVHKEDPSSKTMAIMSTWNVSADAVIDPHIMRKLKVHHATKQKADEDAYTMCIDYDYDTVGSSSQPLMEFDTIEPIRDSKKEFVVAWGPSPHGDECRKRPSVSFTYACSISDEQKAEAKSAERWPFKQCKEHLGNGSFVPDTVECYEAAEEMSTYRNYEAEMTLTETPRWLESAVEAGLKWWQRSTKTPQVVIMHKGNGVSKFHYTKSVPMHSDDVVVLTSDNKTQVVPSSTIGLFPLVNPKVEQLSGYKWASGACVVSTTTIHTIANKTIRNYQKDHTYLLLGECSSRSEFIVLMAHGKHGLDITVTSKDEGTTKITPTEGDFKILQDGNIWDPTKESDNYNNAIYLEDGIPETVHYRTGMYHLTHRKNYIIIILFMDTADCGLCNPKEQDYTDFIYDENVE